MSHTVWGVELSPFVLKLESLLKYAGVPFRRLPRDGGRIENLRTGVLIERAKKKRLALRYPVTDELDEYPLVPFLITETGEVLFDSSAIALWLDQTRPTPNGPLVPQDPALRFVANLIDEAFDDIGLYMVHHNRWKVAALDNGRPGLRLAREYARYLPPLPGLAERFASWFERRQVRRLPYLFSVAPAGYRQPGLPEAFTPPSRSGFPATHELLEESWRRYVDACDTILRQQPFLLGARFSLADASAYGQLSTNLTDPEAARQLRDRSTTTAKWLCAIRDGEHVAPDGALAISPALRPLLEVILETYVPLMRANDRAYSDARNAGATRFNEAAFDAGECLYDGEILGHPFRSVVKTFQVRVWRDLRAQWAALSPHDQHAVNDLIPQHDLSPPFTS